MQRQTQQLSRRLERLTAEEAAKALSDAAGKMDQGRQAGQSGNAQGIAKGQSRPRKPSRTRRKTCGRKHFEAAAQLAMEQQARVQDAVQHLHRQEEEIAKETREFAGMERDGALGRAKSQACWNWPGSKSCWAVRRTGLPSRSTRETSSAWP